ncbi:MAG: FAD-dependent oxidoreductase [Pseudomonadota bacterium]
MLETEIAIIGAGPAGLSAACAAREAGAEVTVLDDQLQPGGQLFKQIHKFFGSKDHMSGTRGFKIGQQLLAKARDLGVKIEMDTKVTGIFNDLSMGVASSGQMDQLKALKIIIAAGAEENRIMFPGWTLPGVMTAGAAQTLANIHRVLPGKRILMVGSGNVGLIVTYQLLQAGADCEAIVEALPSIGGYLVHAGKVLRAGVPILTGHTISEVRGTDRVEEAVVVRLDKNGKPDPGTEQVFNVDTVCLAVGLSPSSQLTHMAGCAHEWNPPKGGRIAIHNDHFETTVSGIYVAGDVAGVEEASTAMEQGRIAGLAAAESLGYLEVERFKSLHIEAEGRLRALRRPEGGKTRDSGIETETWYSELKKTGVLDPSHLQSLPGVPSLERMQKGPVAIIECGQEIPCNPCVANCHLDAVSLQGDRLTDLPCLDEDKCTGCGLCIPKCPGQAIFVVDISSGNGVATVSFAYEYLPLPQKDETVTATDRRGNPVVSARVKKVVKRDKDDQTAVLTLEIPVEHVHSVRGIQRKKKGASDAKATESSRQDSDLVVCRCEEITKSEIIEAIEDGAHTMWQIRRLTRCGMGLCQGRSCEKNTARILSETLSAPLETVSTVNSRPPVQPVPIKLLCGDTSGKLE